MSLPTKLLIDMATHGSSPTMLNKILDALRRQKVDVRTYFEDPHSPAIVRDWYADPKIQDWISRVEGALDDASSSRGIFHKGMSPEEECEASIALMDSYFKKCNFGHGGMRIYQVLDEEKKLLAAVPRNDEEEFAITGVLKPVLRENNCILSIRQIKETKNWWLGYADDIPRPKLCAQPDEDVWCLWRVPISPDAEARDAFSDDLSEDEALVLLATMAPATHSFFCRLSDAAALAAFHWGIASGEYQGRQIAWIQGEGQDGKSKWMKAYSDSVFGGTEGVATVIQNNTLKNSAQFAASLFVDKRFAYVPDSNNTRLLMSETFKSFADPGTDPVVINHKYGRMYTSELEANVAILSNHLPEITGERWLQTRLLLLRIDPLPPDTVPDPSFGDRFKAEMPIFLAYGRYCYRRRCVQHAVIETNETTSELVESLVEDTGTPWRARFEKFFTLDPDGTITPQEVYDTLTTEGRCSQYDVTGFKRWLGEEMKDKVVQTRAKGHPRVYVGMRRRLDADSDIRARVVNVPFGDQGFNGLDDQEEVAS